MSKVQMLRSVVKQRLTAAAQEIFGLFERTISEYEEELSASKEENERQRRLLDAVFNPEVRIQRAGVQQLFMVNEQVPSEQQDWSSSLYQEDPEPPHVKEDPAPPHIKEEQEELWTSQEGEQLQGLEEAGITFSFTPVKSEDDEEEAQSSQLHQRQTEQMETDAYGADCGGSEPDRKSDPERHPGPDTFETEYSRDWEETQQNNEVPVSDVNYSTGNTSISSSECAGSFDHKGHLEKHSESQTRVKPLKCSVCDKRFRFHSVLKSHMIVHSGDKPFSCLVCGKAYARKGSLNYHMTVHTGDKPFSCSVCGKKFLQKGSLNYHMTVHTGEKRFRCNVCGNAFLHKGHLNTHMIVHTGEKPFSCSVCGKSFTHKQSMKRHLIVHTRETN